MGRVFEREGEGHQFNQHYLDSMFPLKQCSPSSNPLRRGGIGNSGFDGVDEDNCEFMNSIIELGHHGKGEEKKDEREGLEISYLGTHGVPLERREEEVIIRDMSPILTEPERKFTDFKGFTNGESEVLDENQGWVEEEVQKEEKKTQFKVKDLSRLWLYVNGKSPKMDEMDVGIARMTTI